VKRREKKRSNHDHVCVPLHRLSSLLAEHSLQQHTIVGVRHEKEVSKKISERKKRKEEEVWLKEG